MKTKEIQFAKKALKDIAQTPAETKPESVSIKVTDPKQGASVTITESNPSKNSAPVSVKISESKPIESVNQTPQFAKVDMQPAKTVTQVQNKVNQNSTANLAKQTTQTVTNQEPIAQTKPVAMNNQVVSESIAA